MKFFRTEYKSRKFLDCFYFTATFIILPLTCFITKICFKEAEDSDRKETEIRKKEGKNNNTRAVIKQMV